MQPTFVDSTSVKYLLVKTLFQYYCLIAVAEGIKCE